VDLRHPRSLHFTPMKAPHAVAASKVNLTIPHGLGRHPHDDVRRMQTVQLAVWNRLMLTLGADSRGSCGG
jgi:hypothetical protein